MNRTRLKNYSPKARLDFIRAVTDRARKIGLTANSSEPVKVSGDVAIILGQHFPRVVAEQRCRLDERIGRLGFGAVVEEVAYTWFNRFMAIRYMELHGYLDHGFRVLSHPEGRERPEILDQAEHVNLPGLDRVKVIELKLDGNQDETLYKTLLLAQCHALHAAMPFLFEKIDDQTELLLPDNLLASDSVIRKMVTEIAEEDWEQIEVIGWLYQFYISDKKDEVIGKVVKSEDIPAATQLFTPNWIVKYMVQNSLGRKWLDTYPNSPLKTKMEYYIEPAEQTPEVQAQLDAITPAELNPEELTLIDPACGSGHILCEAYDLFKEIYIERGYRLRDIPRLILTKNVYGLDIDDRAAQMAGFALLMKARTDDRRILDNPPLLSVLALQSSMNLNAEEIASALLIETSELFPSDELFPENCLQSSLTVKEIPTLYLDDIHNLRELFVNAKTFGSLTTIPKRIAAGLPAIRVLINTLRNSTDLLKQQAIEDLELLISQAEILDRCYDVAATNPPYMGSKFYDPSLKVYIQKHYSKCKSDLYGCFIERCSSLTKANGWLSLITIPNWMFLSSFEELRLEIAKNSHIGTLVHNGRGIFGSDFGTCMFTIRVTPTAEYMTTYKRLFAKQGSVSSSEELSMRMPTAREYHCSLIDLARLPGLPIAYWVSDLFRDAVQSSMSLDSVFTTRLGMSTANNDRFLRRWHEVAINRIGFVRSREEAISSTCKWFPYMKGGDFRKWYGNLEHVVDWENDGASIRSFSASDGRIRSHNYNLDYIFREGITWSDVTSSVNAFRYMPPGFIFDGRGSSGFIKDGFDQFCVLGLLNSKVSGAALQALNPTIALNVGEVGKIPLTQGVVAQSSELSKRPLECVAISRADWNSSEVSWEFQRNSLVGVGRTIEDGFRAWDLHCQLNLTTLRRLEEENNHELIELYGLSDEISETVADDQITLANAERQKDIQRLLSYNIGCTMGRYSMDQPGLIYAKNGNYHFDPSLYTTLPADDDGIIPLTDADWFAEEDAFNRFSEFLKVAWSPEAIPENMKFVAESLGPKAGEAPADTIRRYLCTEFYKFHLQMYKRRPIYWLFSSGKERAFQALVYLHRYNEGTLARMRMDYVVPLQSRMSARVDQLREDIAASVTTADRKKREKEREKLLRQLEELRTFDEKLRHYADMRISLDLDDGVKVNYGKFGDLLAEVKAVTGGSDE